MTPGKDSRDEPVERRDPEEFRDPAEPSGPARQPAPATGRADAEHADAEHEGEEHEDVTETVVHAARSEDRPMERKTPQAPFALVGLSYFTVLAVIGLIIGIVLFWLSR